MSPKVLRRLHAFTEPEVVISCVFVGWNLSGTRNLGIKIDPVQVSAFGLRQLSRSTFPGKCLIWKCAVMTCSAMFGTQSDSKSFFDSYL